MNSTVARGAAISLRQAVAMQTPKALELWLDVVDDRTDRAHQVTALSAVDRRRLGELLDAPTAVELFGSVNANLGAKVLKAQPISRAGELLTALDAERAADILRHCSGDRREQILTAMPMERAKVLRGLLSWPADSVAAHMAPETLTVSPTTTASQAVAGIRARAATQRDGWLSHVRRKAVVGRPQPSTPRGELRSPLTEGTAATVQGWGPATAGHPHRGPRRLAEERPRTPTPAARPRT